MLIKRFYQSEKGAVLLLVLILFPLIWLLWSIAIDLPENNFAAVTGKRAVNRAVKAAVLAVDEEVLATGVYQIEPWQARVNFNQVLRLNLHLNADFTPRETSPVSEEPEILDYYICQGPDFPSAYSYTDANINFTYVFNAPGVAAVVKIKSEQIFSGQERDMYLYSAAEAKS